MKSYALMPLTMLACAASLPAAQAPALVSKEALDQALGANVEMLGVVQTQARLSTHVLSRGTSRYPPRCIISFWSMADRSFFRTFVVDLHSSVSRIVDIPGFEKDVPRWPFVFRGDGKVLLSTMRGALAVYDPVDDSFRVVRPCPKATWLRGLAVGADGAAYVSGYPKGDAGRYDPDTGDIETYGPQGGPFRITHVYGYSVGSDGKWVYTASGKIPWYVTACNRETKQQTKLFEFGQADFPNVRQIGPDVYLSVRLVDQKAGTATTEHHRLKDGAAVRVDAVPAAPKVAGAWDGVPQPKLSVPSRALPIVAGNAILRYEPAGTAADASWREVKLPMPGEPYEVRRVAPTGDGRLVLATGIYGDVFLFDPKTSAFERVGNPANRNVYCLLEKDGTIYFGGYANAFLGAFENGEGKMLFDWNAMLGSKRSLDLVAGADGRLYLGCHAEREFVGGSLAWWDPNAPEGERAGGIRFPNDEASCTITAVDGKLVVVATTAVRDPANPDIVPAGGKIVVYSTEKHEVVREFVPLPRDGPPGRDLGAAGFIAETRPGHILGVTRSKKEPTLYTADVLTGQVEEKRRLPCPADGGLKRGPDGMLYTFLGKTLVRIDPHSLRIKPLGKTTPGRMAFVGDDLYLTEAHELRRIPAVTGIQP